MLVRSALLMILALVPGCCLTGGWHECDSATYVGGCEGQRYSVCFRTGGSWSGEYEELMEGECAANEACIAPGPNQAACVAAPARMCDPSAHVGRCDGNTPVACRPPNSWLTEYYEVHDLPCAPNEACSVVAGFARCDPR